MTLTPDEMRAIDLTAELWNLITGKIVLDGPSREGDLAEFALHIHNIQHAIMAQSCARSYPMIFRRLGGDG